MSVFILNKKKKNRRRLVNIISINQEIIICESGQPKDCSKKKTKYACEGGKADIIYSEVRHTRVESQLYNLNLKYISEWEVRYVF